MVWIRSVIMSLNLFVDYSSELVDVIIYELQVSRSGQPSSGSNTFVPKEGCVHVLFVFNLWTLFCNGTIYYLFILLISLMFENRLRVNVIVITK